MTDTKQKPDGSKGLPELRTPDAVADAFDNLKKSGEKRGRVTVDALKDIAYEANELNQKTLVVCDE